MNIKELAKRVYEERKEAETRKIEDYVRKILEIFNASNSSVGTLLVWQIRLEIQSAGGENEGKNLDVRVSFDKSENGSFYHWNIFDVHCNNIPILKEMLLQLEIPRELFDDLYEYFNENLSEYLATKKIGKYSINIKLKNEPICEKREPR